MQWESDFLFITWYFQPKGTAPLLFKCGSEYSFVFVLLNYPTAPFHLKCKLMELLLSNKLSLLWQEGLSIEGNRIPDLWELGKGLTVELTSEIIF